MSLLKAYYRLTKPGIVYGNTFHLVAGYIIALSPASSVRSFLGATTGTMLVIGSACVVNNIIDRNIDKKMKRTMKRATVTGQIPLRHTVGFAIILGLLGTAILVLFSNWLVVVLGCIAYVSYVVVYGYAKRTTTWSTVIGSVPGAIPLVAGYVADSGVMTLGAWLLFGLLAIWQMPHFYAIALYRKEQYASTGLPLITTVRTDESIRRRCIAYGVAYLVVVAAMGATHTVGSIATGVLVIGGFWWLWGMLRPIDDSKQWGKKVFLQSLVLTVLLFVAAIFSQLWR